MDNRKKKTVIITFASIVLIVLAILLLVMSGLFDLAELRNNKEEESNGEVQPGDPVSEEKRRLRSLWLENKAINKDYIGDLFFDSGIINVSFVQAKSVYDEDGELRRFYTEDGKLVTEAGDYTGNDVYIWTYWKTGEYDYNDNGGSTFMDYRNDLHDQNLIIYGHHFSVWNDKTRSKAFTPLELFLDQENYEPNKYATLVLEDEIRRYEVVSVYQFDMSDQRYFNDFQYWRTNYNYDEYNENAYEPDYYQNYINGLKEVQLYDTGVKLTVKDKTLTLQTCISGYTGELYEIVVLKQISVDDYIS